MMQDKKELFQELNHAIDWDKVLGQFADQASFSLSKESILHSLPKDSLLSIREDLQLVHDAIQLFQGGCTLSLHGCTDISSAIQKATKGMCLSPRELHDIVAFLEACQRTQKALEQAEEGLQEYARSMDICRPLLKQITQCIDATGSVRDNASSKLVSLRDQLFQTRSSLNDRARDFVKRHSASLMENVTTSVGGRVCILVRTGEKNSFGGMVHGQSQSGLASYVEPSSFVSLNNQVQLLVSQIESEKQRICEECSRHVEKYDRALLANQETMVILDVAFAKAKWTLLHDGCVPKLQTHDHSLILEHACHPLIDQKKVVPNTYRLHADQKILMITGPNMGGKTVTLKTIGLFTALTHAGFPVSSHRALLPYYDSFWFDIGDQQSIENDLSTFSSHIRSLARICKDCDENSFILLDEIGNGTDPAEGSALAIAILEYLASRNCTVITSTHYNALKLYGKTHAEVLVACMQFDEDTFRATYRYIPGVSGASYAFSIAQQYHLEPSILENAIQIKKENEDEKNRELEKLERLQNDVEKQKERFDQLIKNAHQIQKEARQEKEKLEKQRARFEQEYQDKLDALVQDKEQEAKELFEKLKRSSSLKPHQQTQFLQDLSHLSPQKPQKPEKDTFRLGDYVQIEGLQSHGEIIELRKKEATVLTNGMKMKVKTNTLKKIARPQIKPVKARKGHTDKIFTRVPLELNIIGYHVEEGLQALDHYLDQCVAHNIKQVRIIHGMGTGKLRSAVLKDLSKHPAVKNVMSAGPSDGGLGATIVELK